jgi:hypothetical protein
MCENLVSDAKIAVVIAEREKYVPGIGSLAQKNWLNFLDDVQNNGRQPADATMIHENIWLIPVATGLPFVSELIGAGGRHSVAIRILFLNDIPAWIEYPPIAKPAA